jgi:hypothetical protein
MGARKTLLWYHRQESVARQNFDGTTDCSRESFQHVAMPQEWRPKCHSSSMSISPLNLGSLQSIVGTALQSVGISTNSNSSVSSSSSTSSVQQPDNGRLSPFAQLMSTLQQLQQSNPTQYQQVTQQIATNLQSASQTAQADGNTTLASQLNQLGTDFSNASKSGQLPNVQDLAQAVGGGHHHHHHAHAASSDSDSSSSSSTSSTSSTSTSSSQSLSQLLAAFQASAFQSAGTVSSSLDPMSIINNTLSSAGINIPS